MMAVIDEREGDVGARPSRRRGILGGVPIGGRLGWEFCDVLAGPGNAGRQAGSQPTKNVPLAQALALAAGAAWPYSWWHAGLQKGYVRS